MPRFRRKHSLLGAPFLQAYDTLFDMEYFRIDWLDLSIASTAYCQQRVDTANYSLSQRESRWVLLVV